MWKEVKGRSMFGKDFVHTSKRALQAGDTVTLGKKGIFSRRQVDTVAVQIIDEDHASIFVPHEPHVVAGMLFDAEGGDFSFGYYINNDARRDDLDKGSYSLVKQDVWTEEKGGKVHGLIWVDENGRRENPIWITSHHSFYSSDTDPEAQMIKAKIEKNDRDLHEESASFNGLSIKITVADHPQTPPQQ